MASSAASLVLTGCGGGGSSGGGPGSVGPTGAAPTAGPTPTAVHLSPNAEAKLSKVSIAATDIGADAVLSQQTNVSLEVAAGYFAPDPAAMANLQAWGFLGGNAQTFHFQGSNVTVLVQAFDKADGAHAAFGAFSKSAGGLPSGLQSTDKVTVTDVKHALLSVPPMGDEVYGSETSTTLSAKELRGQSVSFSVRAVVFRKGDLMVSLTSTPSLATDLLITAAQQIAAKV